MSDAPAPEPIFAELVAATNYSFLRGASPVSYTHLTLPTSDLV